MPIPEYYVPAVGDKVKLETFDDYKQFAPGVSGSWNWFIVEEVVDSTDTRPEYERLLSAGGHVVKMMCTDGGEKQGDPIIVPCAIKEGFGWRQVIQAPIGWEPKYTIHARNTKECAKLRDWLDSGRGIKIWQSQDLSCLGRQNFTPGDVEEGHWSMGAIETVHDPDRVEIIDAHAERMKVALKDMNHAKALDAACEISGEVAGQFKALVDAYIEEYNGPLQNNRIHVVKTGYGVFQRTKTLFEGFGYLRYKMFDRPNDYVIAFFIKPLTEREISRITNRILFRVPSHDDDWYVTHFTKDGKSIGFGMWTGDNGSIIDEYEKEPRERHALYLGDWPEGLTDA